MALLRLLRDCDLEGSGPMVLDEPNQVKPWSRLRQDDKNRIKKGLHCRRELGLVRVLVTDGARETESPRRNQRAGENRRMS